MTESLDRRKGEEVCSSISGLDYILLTKTFGENFLPLRCELWDTNKELKETCKALEVRKKWTYKMQTETELSMKIGHKAWKEHSPAPKTSCLLPNTADRKHPLCWWTVYYSTSTLMTLVCINTAGAVQWRN